jgi:Ser/Thr protein kinase RdoA (MazF antagonist)
MTSPADVPLDLLARWRELRGRRCAPLRGGLINSTYLVEGSSDRFVLQRLNPLWTPEVCEDVEAVTRHLAAAGLVTPRLVPTGDGARCFVDEQGCVWRAQTFIEGAKSYERLEGKAHARAAGALVGKAHRALDSLAHEYRFTRGNVHDTPKHLATLRRALQEQQGHRLYDEVRALAEPLLEESATLPSFAGLPARHAHGDLKVSNLLFDEEGQGLCLVDLDTLARMIWPFEMGDALRSWCNPRGEDVGEARFDLDLFEAAMQGYAAAAPALITAPERALLLDGVATISLELSARFLADALLESYFGYDPERFASRGEHNLVRGKGQWALYRSVVAQRDDATAVLEAAFRS